MVNIRFNEEFSGREARIKVAGIGGGGGNAVNSMVDAEVRGVDFIALNTDAQVLKKNRAATRIQLGEGLTKGLGAGGDPARGRQAAQESSEMIKEVVEDADLLFITAGMGGGTGTGAAPVVAEIAKQKPETLVVGVVTRPFDFEGPVKAQLAEAGIKEMRAHADCLLVVPNQRLLELCDRDVPMGDSYKLADEVLRQAIQGISDIITSPGFVNVDFQDVKRIMTKSGEALIGIGQASGQDRHLAAARKAVHSPLLENADITGAKGLLVSFCSSSDLKTKEFSDAMDFIRKSANPDAFIKYGQFYDESMGGDIRITVIATGFPAGRAATVRQELEHGRISAARRQAPRPQHEEQPLSFGPSAAPQDHDFEKPAFIRAKGPRKLT